MNLSKLKRKKGFIGFLTGIVTAGTLGLFVQARETDSYFEISKNLDVFTSLFKELNTYYVDPIEPGELVKNGIDAMLDNLDPYTNYITESDIENFEFQTTGKYGGIGASVKRKDDYIYIGDVQEFSPAQQAGLHPGDQVLSIDNQEVKGKTIDDLSVLLKGSPGTQLSMRVKDVFTGIESTKILTRGKIEISSVPYAGFVGKNSNVGYVVLTQFTPGCSRLVRSALDSLKSVKPGMKGVVLDLRNNPGGLLDEAVAVCNLFIDRGQLVVSTKGKLKETDREYKTQGTPWDMNIPLAVIINNSSASASEIVAGTMQDLDRGVIIGEKSYGKGLVQVTRPLGYNAQVKITISRYFTPSGRCIQAIDYAHRNDDGSIAKIPDSLKKEYNTLSGRKVLSGGGIEPDVHVKDEPVSKLLITLYIKNYFFDYATQYVKTHERIPPAGSFALSDEDFNQFAKWLDNKEYSYKTETEIALDSLKNIAQREKYFEAIKADYSSLLDKVSHDKKQDLAKNKAEILKYLESEIASRYYFQRGRIENSLRTDNELDKSLAYLEQPAEYKSILNKTK